MEGIIEDMAWLEDWFHQNENCFIIPYIEKNFAQESWGYEYFLMLNNLIFTRAIIDDDLMEDSEKIDELLNSIKRGKSKIMMVVGARGSGKTAIGLWAIEELKNRGWHKRVYYVGKPEFASIYPKWIKFVSDLDKLPPNCVAIVDESAIKFSSRRSMTDINVDLSNRLAVLRHDGISLILITQNVMMLEINVDRLADIIIYKVGTTYGMRRAKEQSDQNFWKQKLMIMNRLRPISKEDVMIEYRTGHKSIFRKFHNPLPTFWDEEKISKSFKGQINIIKKEKFSPLCIKKAQIPY